MSTNVDGKARLLGLTGTAFAGIGAVGVDEKMRLIVPVDVAATISRSVGLPCIGSVRRASYHQDLILERFFQCLINNNTNNNKIFSKILKMLHFPRGF